MKSALFTVEGQTVHGKRLGSKLGFPTANIAYDAREMDWPRNGVYIAIAKIKEEGKQYVAILNQGRHPTAPEGPPTVEAHLLDYEGGELYGKGLTLEYQVYLRPEEKFSSLDALREQLARDRTAAERWARANKPTFADSGEKQDKGIKVKA